MVDHILRLKLAVLGSAFRGRGRAGRAVAAVVLVAAAGGSILFGATEFRPADLGDRSALVIIASVLALALAISPLTSGLGSAVEPRRFASYPVPPHRLALGLGLAGAVGIPGVLSSVLAAGLAIGWAGTPTALAAVAAGILGAIAIILTSLYLVAVAAQLAVSASTARVVTQLARGLVVVCVVTAGTTALVANRGRDTEALAGLAEFLGSTPLGMLWAAPAGPPSVLGARLLGGLVLVVVMAAGWVWTVGRLLETPQRIRLATRRHGLGIFDFSPSTPSGVIAARSIVYWTRDPRYSAALLALPIGPALMMLTLLIAGVPLSVLWLLPLPVIALFLGWFSHNDVAYDDTALWLHVVADVRGSADRWGRAVPPLLIGMLILGLGAPLVSLWTGIDGVFPALLGISGGLLLTGIGVSSVASALAPYPAARPGSGPFDQPPIASVAAGWSQGLSLAVILSVMAPSLVIAWWGISEDPAWLPIAGLAGGATGVGMLALGVLIGGRVFRRRAPELLDFMLRG